METDRHQETETERDTDGEREGTATINVGSKVLSGTRVRKSQVSGALKLRL